MQNEVPVQNDFDTLDRLKMCVVAIVVAKQAI
ncbi:hypothetical protein EV682_101321 [Iodobacter fluviatilis]|uniref:Uncharacterized protein n=1 Tax=Iodobacter fluviatilis TaxID=537 RepID=A0A377Q310_9NEIS|nr:hypothetical protein EV682_101321 [Iodobacter fluviatilis]STQ89323.1 Uncharacterised protein [Iodobacter fluviatilis]